MQRHKSGQFISIGELADKVGVQSWRIARLFESGVLVEPPRIANRRVIPETMVPKIVAALQERGWLPVDPQPFVPPK